jgi:hypothetical protein
MALTIWARHIDAARASVRLPTTFWNIADNDHGFHAELRIAIGTDVVLEL